MPCCVRCVCGLRRPLYNLPGECKPLFCALCRPHEVTTVNVKSVSRCAPASCSLDTEHTTAHPCPLPPTTTTTPTTPTTPTWGDSFWNLSPILPPPAESAVQGSPSMLLPRIRLCKSLRLYPDHPCYHPAHAAQAYRGYCAACFHRLFPRDTWTIQQEARSDPATAIPRFLQRVVSPFFLTRPPPHLVSGAASAGGPGRRRGRTGERMTGVALSLSGSVSPWLALEPSSPPGRHQTWIGRRYWMERHVLDVLFVANASHRADESTVSSLMARPACANFFRKRVRQCRETKQWQGVQSCTTLLVGLASFDHPLHPTRHVNPQLFTRLDKVMETIRRWAPPSPPSPPSPIAIAGSTNPCPSFTNPIALPCTEHYIVLFLTP